MTNILEAICNIIEQEDYQIRSLYSANNRINNVGEALEEFMKDAFANTFEEIGEQEKNEKYSNVFSWLGNQNNIPDFMIRGGDAIEVKKIEGRKPDIALNSSYPKAKLNILDTNKACQKCEEWDQKDLIYSIGHISEDSLKSLWMIYGTIYAAQKSIYQRIKTTISDGISVIPNVEFEETKELGRVNRVDPLGITKLRIRGMWHIQNPKRVFEYIHPSSSDNDFELVTIIPTEKYNSFKKSSRARLENMNDDNLSITDVRVKNPNNPANLVDCKLIVYTQ